MEAALPLAMNDLGGARTGQRNLSEAGADLAGHLGLDLVGEAIAGVFRFALGIKPKQASSMSHADAFEIPLPEED